MQRRVTVSLSAVATLLLTGCGALGSNDGAAVAHDRMGEIALEISQELSRPQTLHSSEHFAAMIAATGFANAEVVPLLWSGQVASPPDTGDPGLVVVRVDVAVQAKSGSYVGERGHSAGSASACFEYELRLNRPAEARETDCPRTEPDRAPRPDPSFPSDTEARVEQTLRAADAADFDTLIRAAFPERHVVVETGVVAEELVVALSVPADGGCEVFVRHADASIERVSFDPTSALPGELGCSVWLYGRPDS